MVTKLSWAFVRVGQGKGRGYSGTQINIADAEPLMSGSLTVTSSPTVLASQPAVPTSPSGSVYARLEAIGGPVYVDINTVADPTADPRLLLFPGQSQTVRVSSLQKLSAIVADADYPTTGTFARKITWTTNPFVLTSAWQKVATVTSLTQGLRIGQPASDRVFDIEWTVQAAGTVSLPSDTLAECIQGGENFAEGLPIGDVYCRSASGRTAIVKVGV